MNIEDIKIAVIGSGMMESQIAEILSRVGNYEVQMTDVDLPTVERGLKLIDDRLERFFVAKNKLTPEDKKSILARIKVSMSTQEAVSGTDLVIEAVAENLKLKKEVFEQLDRYAPKNAILASNTSYQNISEIASATMRPDKVVGLHFFNPVVAMRLVEVVRGANTSDDTVRMACQLADKLGKEPLVCRDFSYGFLANRAYRSLVDEAVQMVWERVASPSEIDKALKLGYNLPMGPLELGDMIGTWGLRADSEQDSLRELGPEKGRLHPLVRAMIRGGYRGGKDHKGIHAFWSEVLSKSSAGQT